MPRKKVVVKKPTPEFDDAEVLLNWTTLNENLTKLKEDDCWRLLDKERETKNRRQFVLRLFGRGNILRGHREREFYALTPSAR